MPLFYALTSMVDVPVATNSVSVVALRIDQSPHLDYILTCIIECG
jgi:hypothetical protein